MISKHDIFYQVERVQPLLWGGKSKQEGRVCSGKQVRYITAYTCISCGISWHMGEISQGVQSLDLVSYFLYFLAPSFGNLKVRYAKTCNLF